MRGDNAEAVRAYVKARIIIEDRGHATPCWVWQLSLNGGGYGQGKAPGAARVEQAHRFAYRAFVGAIPNGLHLDHLCRVRACCNPAHLEPVTPAENARRAIPYMVRQRQKCCRRGHELSGDNVLVWKDGRRCRRCFSEWQKLYTRPERLPTKKARSHCRKGHELTPENTINWKGFLRCRACNVDWRAKNDDHRARFQRYKEEKRAAANEAGRGSGCSGQRPALKEMFAPHLGGVR